jgi:parallel beta-helix repeat protein
VQRNTNIGIYVQLDCVVDSCQVIDNGPGSGQGIRIAGSGTRVENNTVSGSWSGISLSDTATDNLIIRNTVRKGGGLAGIIMSGQAVNSFPNNHVAQIIVDPASPFTATNAFANIQY